MLWARFLDGAKHTRVSAFLPLPLSLGTLVSCVVWAAVAAAAAAAASPGGVDTRGEVEPTRRSDCAARGERRSARGWEESSIAEDEERCQPKPEEEVPALLTPALRHGCTDGFRP